MKPYYQDEWVTIYNENSCEVFDEVDSCDLLLTDPPYGVGGGSGTKGKQRSHKHDYLSFDDTPENVRKRIIPFIRGCIDRSTRAIITTGAKLMCHYPQPDGFGVFYQPASCGMQHWGRCDSQPIFYYGKDPRSGKTIDFCSYQLTEKPSCKEHPCSKPIKAWSWLLNKGSLEGETVLDPFMGSGTTLRAAKDLGRKAIGIEVEERYCEIAAKRMAQEVFAF